MENSFHYLLMADQAMLQKLFFGAVKSKGLTAGQPKVLDYLKDHDGAGQKEIAAGCHIEAATLTSVLNRMEEKGMIRRQMKNGNRRSLYVFLTDYGRELAGFVEQEFARAEQAVFSGFSEEEQEECRSLLGRIYENLAEKIKE
ncbi:MAG TPA: MarR family transcriptional regulator [Candidatus Lachnoclostridium pullistercoris]|uniref:MarR family transcriptional regulator n=1 Tax=Candidatus Lachnoclostridium pullistercoris TaxID=2838632 RepID=A0A9D2T4H9_9FIRM|nr:MarR family transcriptional regulator [Candidatus Lachnoclostridium pullistercoris]